MNNHDLLPYDESNPLVGIANLLFKICDVKIDIDVEENLVKLANLAIEKLIYESPLSEILRCFDSVDFNRTLLNKYQFEYSRFFHFCRILCSSDKQGYY